MIASPGDVSEERNIIRDVIHEWNDIHSRFSNCVLRPAGWDTHSTPDLGGRPQELINTRVLDRCDLLVGVFWTRIGSPTGVEESGTVEEIRRRIATSKPAMIYFSTAPVAPASLDAEQFAKLNEFKSWCKAQGLIDSYDNIASFAEKFRRHLQIVLRDNEYLRSIVEPPGRGTHSERNLAQSELTQPAIDRSVSASTIDLTSLSPTSLEEIKIARSLSSEAASLIVEASKDRAGIIMSVRYISGQAIQTNGINFADSGDRRSIARWEAGLDELIREGLVAPRGTKGEIYEITNNGFRVADQLIALGIHR